MITLTIIAVTVLVAIRPRLDFTRYGKLLLWYGRKVSKYIRVL